MTTKEARQKRLRTLSYALIIYLTATLFLCQWSVFDSWEKIGLSILIGTCGVLIGGFSALLASPYGSGDKERLSRVGSTISTLITGYILAKVIDPVIAAFTNNDKLPEIFKPENGANVLIAIIGFLAGFLFVYQYRVYISGEILEKEAIYEQSLPVLEKFVENEQEGNHSRETALRLIFQMDKDRGIEFAKQYENHLVLGKISKDILSNKIEGIT